jgi:pimeloyl-ACP methyl ester carboxylesterase
VDLFFRKFGEGQPLVVLHGVFGSSDNWVTLGRQFAEHFAVYLVDQRNHGSSPHSAEMDYILMADDLHRLIKREQLGKIMLIGHSMGGKTAMTFASKYPELLEALVVVDIAPRQYPIHHDQILGGMNALDLPNIKSRKEADTALAAHISNLGIRQFILKNLQRTPEGFGWKCNLPTLTTRIEEVGKPLENEQQVEVPSLFVNGANSSYITDEDVPMIQQLFATPQFATVANAGHWIHAEQPEAFMEVVLPFLQQHKVD